MTEAKDAQVRLGVIGLGERGRGLLKMILEMDDVAVPAVCDLYEDRLQMGEIGRAHV